MMNNRSLCQNLSTFIIVSSYIFPVRSVRYRSFRENQNKHFMFNYIFLKIMLFSETAWYNVEPDRSQIEMWLATCALHAV